MSWWGRSLVNSLRGDDGDDVDDDEEEETKQTLKSNEKSHIGSPSKTQEAGEVEDGEQEDEGETSTRGVKEDFSELTQTLSRQFWGIASFLAPPPPGPDAGDPTIPGQPDEAASPVEAGSPRIAGIRSDFEEIGGKFRTGISSMLSHTMAVTEISKIASSLLPFGLDEEEEEKEAVGVDAIGFNEEVLAFARNVAMHPETWLDFPLPHGEEDSDEFEMSDAQLEHALAVERLAPEFAALRTELCPSQMGEGCFWKIYFVLLLSRLNGHDAELLSTPQIVEARSMLLQDLHSWTKSGPEKLGREASYGKEEDVTAVPVEENVVQPSGALNVTVPPTTLSYREPASDSTKDIETENYPVQTIATNFMEHVEIEKHPVQTIVSGCGEDVETEKHPVQTITSGSVEDVETEKHPVQTITSGSVEDVETEKHPVQTTEVKMVDKSVIEEEPANRGQTKDISSQEESIQMYEEDGDGWLEEDETGEESSAGAGAISLGQEEDVSFSDLEDHDDDQGQL